MSHESESSTPELGGAHLVSRRGFLRLAAGLVLGVPVLPRNFEDLLEKSADQVSPYRRGMFRGESLFQPPHFRPHGAPLDEGKLFLTFDDGPLPCTSRILDLLSATGHKATFFVIGRNLNDPKLRNSAVRAVREGHDIGNHSYDHPNFAAISPQRAVREIVSTAGLIREVVREAGVEPNRQNLFFRFPYGSPGTRTTYAAAQEVLTELNYRIAWWNVDTLDWRMELDWFPRRPSAVLESLSRARANDVVLLHDRQRTAQYLSAMLNKLDDHKLTSIPLSASDIGTQGMPAPAKDESPAAESDPILLPDEDRLVEQLSQNLFKRKKARETPWTAPLGNRPASHSSLW
jgi:peptidoglycan/xylan/chitin deacetylase (PgdA/CDA1 family)